MMKVSIIIPVYNVSDYIERCLQSVMNQTYKDLECIVVDDCSTDDSYEKCQKLLESYKGEVNFHLFHFQENKGVSIARNIGMEHAKGEYLYFMDSDDAIAPDCIELMVQKVKQHPGVELVQGKMKSIPMRAYYNTDRYDHIDYIDDNRWIRKEFFGDYPRFPIGVCNKLVRFDFIKEHSLFFLPGVVHEDELWAFFLAKKLRKVAFVHQDTYYHYIVPNSIMTTKSNEKRVRSWAKILLVMNQHFDEPYKKLQIERYLEFLMGYYDEYVQLGQFEEIAKSFSKSFLSVGDMKRAFMLYRLAYSKNSDVVTFYKSEMWKQWGKALTCRNILSFEVDMFRVRLALGHRLIHRKG